MDSLLLTLDLILIKNSISHSPKPQLFLVLKDGGSDKEAQACTECSLCAQHFPFLLSPVLTPFVVFLSPSQGREALRAEEVCARSG